MYELCNKHRNSDLGITYLVVLRHCSSEKKCARNQPTYICDCFLGFFLCVPALLDRFLHFILHLGNVTLQLLLLIDQACVLLLSFPQRNIGKGGKVMIRDTTFLNTIAHQGLLIFPSSGLQQYLGR